jgi:hypothetical protein
MPSQHGAQLQKKGNITFMVVVVVVAAAVAQ